MTHKTCYICKKDIDSFIPHLGGLKNVSDFRIKAGVVGSDVENFKCPICGNHDRTRHLFMYFDALEIWQKMEGSKILHIAPEDAVSSKIIERNPSEYIRGDIDPQNPETFRMDVANIPHDDNHFDIVICNHVLEHVPDYLKAFSEIYRVLKQGGFAILQTPLARRMESHFVDSSIKSAELRTRFYGATTHLRLFSEAQFFQELKETGFTLDIIHHSELFTGDDAEVFGVNKRENLIRVNI